MTAATFVSNRPHRFVRSAGAILAGLLVNAIAATATDMLLSAVGIFPPMSEYGTGHSFTNSMFLIALGYITLYGVLGCYVTARLSPARPMLHALILGGIGVAIGTAGAIAMWDAGPAWYSLAVIAVAPPAAWIGGWWYERRSK
jgi:hypothetical protein